MLQRQENTRHSVCILDKVATKRYRSRKWAKYQPKPGMAHLELAGLAGFNQPGLNDINQLYHDMLNAVNENESAKEPENLTDQMDEIVTDLEELAEPTNSRWEVGEFLLEVQNPLFELA